MRRIALLFAAIALAAGPKRITTIAGTGRPGNSGAQINNPYGLTIGPDGALYFCEVDNQRVRRLDLQTHAAQWPARHRNRSSGQSVSGAPRGQRRLSHRFQNGAHYHLAGTGEKGYSGDGGPARLAKLNGPKGVAWAPDNSLYIADTES